MRIVVRIVGWFYIVWGFLGVVQGVLLLRATYGKVDGVVIIVAGLVAFVLGILVVRYKKRS